MNRPICSLLRCAGAKRNRSVMRRSVSTRRSAIRLNRFLQLVDQRLLRVHWTCLQMSLPSFPKSSNFQS